MPFKSKKQRAWMHINKPDMAEKWEKEEKIRRKSAKKAKLRTKNA